LRRNSGVSEIVMLLTSVLIDASSRCRFTADPFTSTAWVALPTVSSRSRRTRSPTPMLAELFNGEKPGALTSIWYSPIGSAGKT